MCAVLVLLKMLLQTDRRIVIEFWPKRLICRMCRLQMLQIYIWSTEKVGNNLSVSVKKITSEATFIMASSENSQDYNVSDEMEIECSEWSELDRELLMNIDLLLGGYGTIVLASLGVCANMLAIAVFCKKSFKSNFNNLLIALAVFDLLFLVVCITESVRRSFQNSIANASSMSGYAIQIHHQLFPYFLYPLHNILLTCSIFMTISISIERYLAIFHPLVYRNR